MSNIVELNSETLFYIKSDGHKISGVGDSQSMIEFINSVNDGVVSVQSDGGGLISSHNLKSLCIAWLALNYPDVLKEDGPRDETQAPK